VFLSHFFEFLLDRGEFGFERSKGTALGRKAAIDEKRRWDKIGLEAPFAASKIILLRPDELPVLVFDLMDFAGLGALFPADRRDEVGASCMVSIQ
jgi:hypothetical protein